MPCLVSNKPVRRARGPTRAALLVFALGALLLGGCAEEGGLTIRLLLPTSPELSPTSGGEISELTLDVRSADGDVQRLSRTLGDSGAGLDLGTLPAEDGLTIAVELRSVGQQLLGYGRSPTPTEIRAGVETEVVLNVRRPLAYLPNRDGVLVAVDASRDLTSAVTPGIELAGMPVASAASADGGDLFVVTTSGATSSVALISTSTHLPSREIASGLRPAPKDLVVTAAGDYVAVAHASSPEAGPGGVTIISVATGLASFVELGDISRLAVDATGELYALGDRSPGCLAPARPASIFRLSLGDVEARSQLTYDGSAGDIAVNPGSGDVLVADPCAGEVLSVNAEGQALFYALAGASALAASRDAILVGGIDSSIAMSVATVTLAGELVNSVELETPTESTVSEDLDREGQSVRVVADADAAVILDLAAVPGSESFAVITQTLYDIEGGGNIPPMVADVWEYQLVSAASETAVHRIRTACELDVDVTFEPLINWRCGRATDQLTLAPEFRVETVSVLYGDR